MSLSNGRLRRISSAFSIVEALLDVPEIVIPLMRDHISPGSPSLDKKKTARLIFTEDNTSPYKLTESLVNRVDY